MSTTRAVLAANVRARIAWQGLTISGAAKRLGLSQQTLSNKIAGIRRFNDEELVRLAELFNLPDPGPLFKVPDDFGPIGGSISESGSACTRLPDWLTSPLGLAAA